MTVGELITSLTGWSDGRALGLEVGFDDGRFDGFSDGRTLGREVGFDDGRLDGLADGRMLGLDVGFVVSRREDCVAICCFDGAFVGTPAFEQVTERPKLHIDRDWSNNVPSWQAVGGVTRAPLKHL